MKNISTKRRWLFGSLTAATALLSIYGSLGIIFPFIAYNMGFKTYEQNKEDSIKEENEGLLPDNFWNKDTKTVNSNILSGVDSQHAVENHSETPKFDLLWRPNAIGSTPAQVDLFKNKTAVPHPMFAIVLHGISNTRAATYSYAWQYSLRGYYVINYDQHGWGDSRSFGNPTYGYQESTDLKNIVSYIDDTFSASQIVIHGLSMGAATTALFSTRYLKDIETKYPQTNFLTIQDAAYTDLYSEFYWYTEHKMKLPGWLVVPQSMIWFNVFAHNDYKAVNPLANFTNFSSPVLIFHGSADDTVSYQFGLDFFKKKVESHQAAMFVNMQAVSHVSGLAQLGHDSSYNTTDARGNNYFKYVDMFLQKYGKDSKDSKGDTEIDIPETYNGQTLVKTLETADAKYKTETWGFVVTKANTDLYNDNVTDISQIKNWDNN